MSVFFRRRGVCTHVLVAKLPKSFDRIEANKGTLTFTIFWTAEKAAAERGSRLEGLSQRVTRSGNDGRELWRSPSWRGRVMPSRLRAFFHKIADIIDAREVHRKFFG